MATEQNQLQTHDAAEKAFEAEQAFSPTPEDGAGTDAPVGQTGGDAPRGQDQSGEDKPDSSQHWQDDRRKEIFARAREKRLSEVADYSNDPNDPALAYGANTDKSELGDLERQALDQQKRHLEQNYGQQQSGQQPAPARQDQPSQRKPLNGLDPQFLDQRLPIKVDGQVLEVSMEDLIRNYQIEQAAQRRLETARAVLAQSHQIPRGPAGQTSQPAAGYEGPSEQDGGQYADQSNDDGNGNTSQPPLDMAQLVEKIQLGSPEEAAAALQSFVQSSAPRQAAADPLSEFDALQDKQSTQAVMSFVDANPQIGLNPAIQHDAIRHIHVGMAEDLKAAGFSDEELYLHCPTPQALSAFHKRARIANVKGIRPVDQLVASGFKAAVDNLRGAIGGVPGSVQPQVQQKQPQNPAASLADRQERKNRLQNQPAARRLSPGFSQTEGQARSVEQSRADAFTKMRKARGFSA